MSEELKAIYLQPECCSDEEFGRVWCEHDSPEPCPDGNHWTKYVIVPEGMVLVPVVPTDEMRKASTYCNDMYLGGHESTEEFNVEIYHAMITTYQEGK